MGKKKQAEARSSLLAYYDGMQAANDEAMEFILIETAKPEDEIDWEAVTEHAEVIACDACSGDDEDEPKDPRGHVVRSKKDYFRSAALNIRFEGKGQLAWAAESTLEAIIGRMTEKDIHG